MGWIDVLGLQRLSQSAGWQRASRAVSTSCLLLPLLMASAAQAGTVGAVAVSPDHVTVGQAATATVTVSITDANYLPGSGNVQRLNANGTVQSVVGLLHDDGLNGDAVAGDKVYSLRVPLNEAAAGQVRLQVSAGFRRELRRTASAPVTITVDAAPPSIGAVAISPASTSAGVALLATVTAALGDAPVVPNTVLLQKLDSAGIVIGTVGLLHDDGANGDAAAGDKTWSLRTTVLENDIGTARYRVAAQYAGQTQAVFSAPLTVQVTGTATGIGFSSPGNGAYLNTPVITVAGTVGDANATVNINGIATPVSNRAFSLSVPLNEGPNTITAVAANSNGTTSTASMVVTLDTTAPRVEIYTPSANGSTSADRVTVTGMVNDIVVGTVNPQQATVTINGVVAEVLNRSFMAVNVPLNVGANTLQAVAVDRAGNRATTTLTINRVAAGQAGMSLVSGNNQRAQAGSVLPEPLVVKLVNAANVPQAGQNVVFRVIGADGGVSASGDANTFSSAVSAATDAQGVARAYLKTGRRAGVGNNLVEASTSGVPTAVDFSASTLPGQPALVVVDSGNNQSGVVGQPLPLPFIAIVTDANNNRLANVPVSFAVRSGGGGFAGGNGGGVNVANIVNGVNTITPANGAVTTLQAVSDSDGRIAATLTLGTEQGVNNNVVEVSFAGNGGYPAAFAASGLVPGPADQTRISGVVLDNSNQPIPGVTMRLLQVNQGNRSNIPQDVAPSVTTDAQGQFVMTRVPVGVFKLMADGGTATRSGTWPTLEYDMITVSGQNNTVGMPVYLPELNPANRLCVSDTTGGTLTIAEAPGFALTIAPGSATFPGGSRSGCVSVTPVNMDKVPMAPGFGQQPRFIVTIQPVGTHFNPPARMTIPNVDGLAPRAVTEMYSYDHDLASFVAIGSATVSEDGATITSDVGNGVIKAGWHCGGDPAANGTVADCPDCKLCLNNNCNNTDPAQEGRPCDGGKACCKNGTCAPPASGNPASIGAYTYKETIVAPYKPAWGVTKETLLDVDIEAYFDVASGAWKAKVIRAEQNYNIYYRLIAGVSEASAASATAANFCKMITDLSTLGYPPVGAPAWYMVSAVEAHERQHVSEMREAQEPEFAGMVAALEALSVPNDCVLTPATARDAIKALPGYQTAITTAYNNFKARYYGPAYPDPNANTDAAEHAVVDPVVTAIRALATANGWGACP